MDSTFAQRRLRVITRGASLILLEGPAGFGKSELLRQLVASAGAGAICDLRGAVGRRAVADRILDTLVETWARSSPVPSGQLPLVAFDNADETLADADGAAELLAGIARLNRHATVAVAGRSIPHDLAPHIDRFEVVRIRATSLRVRTVEDALEVLGVELDDRRAAALIRITGGWPGALAAIGRAIGIGTLSASELLVADTDRRLVDGIRPYLDSELAVFTDEPREVLLALCALERASLSDLRAATRLSDARLRNVLDDLDGFACLDQRVYTLAPIIVTYWREKAPVAVTATAHRAVTRIARRDPARAVRIALRNNDFASVAAIVREAESAKDRRALLSAAFAESGPFPLIVNDELFLAWMRLDRTADEARTLIEKLRPTPGMPGEIAQRLAIASMMLSVRLEGFADVESSVPQLDARWLRGELRSVVRATFAQALAMRGHVTRARSLLENESVDVPEVRQALAIIDIQSVSGDPDAEIAILRYEQRRCLEEQGFTSRYLHLALRLVATLWISGRDSAVAEEIATLAEWRDESREVDILCRAYNNLPLADGEPEPPPVLSALVKMLRAFHSGSAESAIAMLREGIALIDRAGVAYAGIVMRVATAAFGPLDREKLLADALVIAYGLHSERLAAQIEALLANEPEKAPYFAPLLARAASVASPAPAASCEIRGTDGRMLLDGKPVELGSRPFQLVLLLALQGRVVSRATLAQQLWPDLEPRDAANALKTCVHRARQAVGNAQLIASEAGGYTLDPRIRFDLRELETLFGGAAASPVFAPLPGTVLQERGDLIERLENVVARFVDEYATWSWFDGYAARIERLIRTLAHALGADALDRRDDVTLLRVAATLRRLDQSDEGAFSMTIRAHLLTGNVLAAHREFERYSAAMREFSEEPAEEIASLLRPVAGA